MIPSFRNSPEADIRNPVRIQYNQIIPGSGLASAASGLGRDDELMRSLFRGERTGSYCEKLNYYAWAEFLDQEASLDLV